MSTFLKSLAVLCGLIAIAPCLAAEPPSLAFIKQLAATPLALVDGNRCEVRGAIVVGNSPQANMRVVLISSHGQSFEVQTNAAGVYRASLQFAGTTTAYRERIAGDIRVPTNLAHQARVLRPAFVCSTELTRLTLAAIQKGNKAP